MTLAVGLMSGTSADGVSAVLAFFEGRRFRLLAYQTLPYPLRVREKILHSLELKTKDVAELDFELGHIFAAAALKVIRRSGVSKKKIAVIGSHGQTLYHGPRDRITSTFQIGEPAVIAEKTGLPVVSDFRPQDIALGGEGAPLIPFFDFYFYGQGPLTAFQNIGGVANVTIVGKGLEKPAAFDTGPGNCLIDLAIQKISQGRLRFDPGGQRASRGRIREEWLKKLKRLSYFKKRPPKSTGRELFGATFLERHFGKFLRRSPQDVLATLTYFTAWSIATGIQRFSPANPKHMRVSGGGVKNQTLMHHLKILMPKTKIESLEKWGLPAQAKEPLAFAFFALQAWRGQINHAPWATGARRATILGKITHPSPGS